MASVEKMAQVNADSEMEEGEIVDELDDLSDISSEEEFLLRQRLEVLEDYNNALERTKKKRSSGIKPMRDLLCDLSEITTAEIDVTKISSCNQVTKVTKNLKQHSKPRRRKQPVQKSIEEAYVRKRDHRKKSNHTKRKTSVKVISESSDESEDEYRNKRKKLADAVVVHRAKTDTSLSARLKNMLHKREDTHIETDDLNVYQNNNIHFSKIQMHYTPLILESIDEVDTGELKRLTLKESVNDTTKLCEQIDLLSSDEDVKVITNDNKQAILLENATVGPNLENIISEPKTHAAEDSDEDLAQLREQVLSTKTLKAKPQEPETKVLSEDEDSDTTELRLICLKSTLLKRAIEMKQKQKLQKRLSQSTQDDDLYNDNILYPSKIDSGNNTDIESMDMDMGSDADEKLKDGKDVSGRLKKTDANDRLNDNNQKSAITSVTNKEEEFEEDEDLLRAKLLTSLSKNLPNLISPEILNTIDDNKISETIATEAAKVPEATRFIIKLGESDSEGEHEATTNLTKMHMKLSEQSDFQQKLDMFLKSTRMQVENTKLPDVVQKQATPKKPEKYVAKAVNHLPKSEQLEYKNLVRRMAELEKMKQLRQASISLATQPFNDTSKARNATIDTNLEEKISISRKKIADESAKMLKLKDEATKLSQKYKIVATELHNISTAISLNKKQQKSIQNCLTKIRQQHQSLIKSSSTSLHSKVNGIFNNFTNKVAATTMLQKENNPTDDYKNPVAQKTVTISVVNDLKIETNTSPMLSVQVNVANNKKVVKMPRLVKENRIVEITKTPEQEITDRIDCLIPGVEKGGGYTEEIKSEHGEQIYIADDYKSPLEAFGETSWKSDPNAILCPFDVGGQCKDPDCKYLHTQLSEQ
ncbi:putative intracellular protein transport protein USO1 [Operophtera brumata]|uniref:Putative intracellular protein transport protein USO1 n=1 Tax=Operophtera brumata TaxID=104452 RepID=A0A0L7L5A4_OPEBR|nr:putative intracellular protein transport protein USO1 [Operophtera brumata]